MLFKMVWFAVFFLVFLDVCIINGFQYQWITHNRNHRASVHDAFNVQPFSRSPGRWASSRRSDIEGEKSPGIANIKYGEVKPRVRRAIEDSQRVPLSNLKVGQMLRGRIISVAEYGLFVDIGTTKDGLVHIKDISNDYFVSNLHSKFIPGQDIDVWVKFVLLSEKKFGLQMFPPKSTPAAPSAAVVATSTVNDGSALSIHDLRPKMHLKGKVVRTSDFGVYVDIGVANTPAFLHRRKMLSNRRQWKYKPWEITPLGTEVTCFIHEVDAARKRIAITTYPPELWATRLLPSDGNRGYDSSTGADDSDSMVEDNEELGGDTRAANLRAVRRTMALQLDDDSEDDDEISDTEWERGETLSPAEIRRLTAHRRGEQLLIDDYEEANNDGLALPNPAYPASMSRARGASVSNQGAGADAGSGAGSGAGSDKEPSAARKTPAPALAHSAAANQFSPDELFDALSNRRAFLTLGDLKKWDYVREMLADGALTAPVLQDLFQQSGARQGRMDVDQFERFVELFVETLGLEEDDGSYSDAEDGEGLESGAVNDAGAVKTNKASATHYLIDDFAPAKPAKIGKQDRLAAAASASLTESDSQEPPTKPGKQDKSKGASTKADKVAAKKAAADAAAAVETVQGAFLNDLFLQLSRGKSHLQYSDLRQWDVLQQLLSRKPVLQADVRRAFDASCGGAGGSSKGLGVSGLGVFLEKLTALEARAEEHTGFSEDEKEEEFEEISVDEAFAELCASESNRGHEHLTFAALCEWPLVSELLEEGHLQREELHELFLQASASNEVQDPTLSAQETALDIEGFNALLDLLDPFADSNISDQNHIENGEATEDGDEEKEYEEVSVDEAFAELCGDTDGVSFAMLCGWPLVRELLEERHLQRDELKSLFLQASTHNEDQPRDEHIPVSVENTVLDIDGFNALLDLLDPFADTDLASDDDSAEDVEQEDYEEISVDEVFAELCGDTNSVSFAALCEWPLVRELLEEGRLQQEELQDLFLQASSHNEGQRSGDNAVMTAEDAVLDIEGFNALLDLLDPFADSDLADEDHDTDHTLTTTAAAAVSTAQHPLVGISAAAGTDDNDESESDEEVSRAAFNAVSQGKAHVSLKDLLNWDFVYTLLAEGVLTEESLQEKVTQYSENNRKGVTQAGFDRLVDDLVLLYKESDFALTAEEGEEALLSANDDLLSGNSADGGSDIAQEGDIQEQEEVLEIDVADEFLRLCGDRDHVTLQDIRSWDSMQEALSFSDLTDADWQVIVTNAGITDVNAIDAQQFEAVLDILIDRVYCGEEGCDGDHEGHEHVHMH